MKVISRFSILIVLALISLTMPTESVQSQSRDPYWLRCWKRCQFEYRKCQDKATDQNKISACKKSLKMCERGCNPEPRRPF